MDLVPSSLSKLFCSLVISQSSHHFLAVGMEQMFTAAETQRQTGLQLFTKARNCRGEESHVTLFGRSSGIPRWAFEKEFPF